VYQTADGAFPFAQIPANTGMRITEGPMCRANGQRMWRVELTLQGQAINGWVSEGFGQAYFLLPGLPRATN
jgi:hypothetical protein